MQDRAKKLWLPASLVVVTVSVAKLIHCRRTIPSWPATLAAPLKLCGILSSRVRLAVARDGVETRMNNGFFVVTEYPDVETWHCHV